MRLAITGEKGFIGSNLSKVIKAAGHEFVSLLDAPNLTRRLSTGEPCVFSNAENDWSNTLTDMSVDVLIHNAAVVGTDVVASPVGAVVVVGWLVVVGTVVVNCDVE